MFGKLKVDYLPTSSISISRRRSTLIDFRRCINRVSLPPHPLSLPHDRWWWQIGSPFYGFSASHKPSFFRSYSMKSKSLLTRRKATKKGVFDPATYHFAPSPHLPVYKEDDRGNREGVDQPVKDQEQLQDEVKKNYDKPLVAVVGRPNVGKSSLFNRLIGQSKSIITPIAGTTRDRVYGVVQWEDWEFILVDTGGLLGDTDEWSSDIHEQAMIAIEEADVIIMVCDVKEGLHAKEKAIARLIRKKNKPILVAVNKVDNNNWLPNVGVFERLGFSFPIGTSAIHGLGEVSLLEELQKTFEILGFSPNLDKQESNDVRIAIIGKPNVGKSSFFNKVIGIERSVVSPIPGTTCDPIDHRIVWKHSGSDGANPVTVLLIDTAGLKKKKYQNPDTIEHLSTLWSLKVIVKSQVVLLLLDAKEGVNKQDVRIGSFVSENYKSSIILFNKWDLTMDKKEIKQSEYVTAAHDKLACINYSPVMFCSAKSGYNVSEVINKAIEIAQNRRKKLSNQKILKSLTTSTLMRKPPEKKGKRMKIKFATQADMGAPTITLFVNDPSLQNDQYNKFLEKRFREDFPSLEGSPIRLLYRKNAGKLAKEDASNATTNKVNKKKPLKKPVKPVQALKPVTLKNSKSVQTSKY